MLGLNLATSDMRQESQTGKKIAKISWFMLVFVLIVEWVFSGWPRIWQNPRILPEVEAQDYATTFLIGGTETNTSSTPVTTITFPETFPGGTADAPYNDVDGIDDPQVLSATNSESVVKIKNTHATTTYNIILEITSWTNSAVDMEYYRLADDGTTTIDAVTSPLSGPNGTANAVSTGVSIEPRAYKDLYLKLHMANVAGKTSTSTLTVLGETP